MIYSFFCRFAASFNKSFNIDRFYTPRRYRSALCKTVKLIQALAVNKRLDVATL